MPRYFFQTSGSAPFTDTVGAELADRDAAWSMAVSSLGELLRDLDGRMPNRAEIQTTVEDADGRALLSLRFTAEKHVGEDESAGMDGPTGSTGMPGKMSASVVRPNG